MVNIFWYPVEVYQCFEFNRQLRETLVHDEKTEEKKSSSAALGYFVLLEMLIHVEMV